MAKVKGPAYQVIYSAILKKINRGEFEKAVAIPSENELAAKYEVSRMTARKSVDMLVAEGYLFRHKGKGTFITGRRNLVRDDISLTARLEKRGQRLYSEIRLFETTDTAPAGFQGAWAAIPTAGPEATAFSGDPLFWKIERIRFVDDAPAVFERVWLPVHLAPDLTADDARRSLAQFLSKSGEIGSLDLVCAAELLEKKKAVKALDLKKDSLILAVQGTMSLMDGTACLYSESWQNTKILPFSLKLLR